MFLKPLIFADGEKFYKQLAQKYRTHRKGLFILAPSGAGKTHYCKNQEEPHWIDGDDLWVEAGAQPPAEREWWKQSVAIINEVEQRCDTITMMAKTQGFWIIGASNYWLVPDAIVIPEWDTHKKYISQRQASEYDGGATDKDHEQVQRHIEIIEQWHKSHNVPKFESVEAAAEAITVKL